MFFIGCKRDGVVTHRIQLSDHEVYLSVCPDCGKEDEMDPGEFFELMGRYGPSECQIMCEECSQQFRAKKEGQEIHKKAPYPKPWKAW